MTSIFLASGVDPTKPIDVSISGGIPLIRDNMHVINAIAIACFVVTFASVIAYLFVSKKAKFAACAAFAVMLSLVLSVFASALSQSAASSHDEFIDWAEARYGVDASSAHFNDAAQRDNAVIDGDTFFDDDGRAVVVRVNEGHVILTDGVDELPLSHEAENAG